MDNKKVEFIKEATVKTINSIKLILEYYRLVEKFASGLTQQEQEEFIKMREEDAELIRLNTYLKEVETKLKEILS